ncbi:cyclohexyl-isocyanide hydratase [Amphibacillus marinus]|uniref:Cyclohexyl-isocyanide hydratase n=1 Tax=Amphibacillus marinus TaxID=872970 RepID=A0A1H8KDG5_9BACI|nr:DJ-1/PfpI family protein [Amphibacillus marinus]SEN90566.1 cyclohexyl-isocyanide hydratase [Amphibacillus marinus]
MKLAFIVFDGMTALDFIGVYDALTRLKTMGFIPDLNWDICADCQQVRDHTGLMFTATQIKPDLANYNMIVVPGGLGTRTLVADTSFITWLETAQHCSLKASVCTGSLLLGAAGFLTNREATTHPNAYQELAKYTVVKEERIVEAGDVITARGVSSSIDLGLFLCEKLAGTEVKEQIRQQMDYQSV